MATPLIHWAGGCRVPYGKTGITVCLAGWPCCCSGDRAERIRRQGLQTDEVDQVTCKACRKMLERAAVGRRTELLKREPFSPTTRQALTWSIDALEAEAQAARGAGQWGRAQAYANAAELTRQLRDRGVAVVEPTSENVAAEGAPTPSAAEPNPCSNRS